MGYYGRRRSYSQWAPYVPVAERRRQAEKRVSALKKKGTVLKPVVIEGRTISKTFWGKAWCDNLESYSDFENRLPRGRTYVRNGSVLDLQVTQGKIEARVMGSSLYLVEITISPMAQNAWETLVKACSGKIDTLIELLQGKFSNAVMKILTEHKNGLFPKPHEIEMTCTCPDIAGMCKHVAATLYGVGASLDATPEHLFLLRHVDHLDLISSARTSTILTPSNATVNGLQESDLSSMFGIDLDTGTPSPSSKTAPELPAKAAAKKKKPTAKPAPKKASKSKKSTTTDTPSSKRAPAKKRASSADGKISRTNAKKNSNES